MRWLTMLAGGAAVALAAAGCWSERAAVAGPNDATRCAASLGPDAAGAVVVFIQDYAFHPATVHVPRGGRVAWVNCGAPGEVAHTSTADAGAWGSGLIAPGASFIQTFDAAGTLPYHCEPHPFMTGEVVVE